MPTNKLVPDRTRTSASRRSSTNPLGVGASSYKRLVTEIASLYEGARRALVEAYWAIGKRIVEVEQQGAVKAAYGAGYGAGLLVKLSQDLTKQCGPGFSERQLRDMRKFYLENRIRRPAAELGWTQHVELLKISDPKIRKILEQRVITESLKRDELRELVQTELVREEVAGNIAADKEEREPVELLTPRRGTLYTYRILDPKTVQPKEEGLLLVDLGFSCYRDLDAVTSKRFKPLEIIESVKTGDDRYKLQGSAKTQTELFTYQATVEKVVDGDTLRVVVDLGFNTRTRQYLRLRGLDCPEMDTDEGQKAAAFVRSRIKQADEITLTSSRSDKYDRYLADVYFIDPKGQEIYLNNLLLQEGLAVGMND